MTNDAPPKPKLDRLILQKDIRQYSGYGPTQTDELIKEGKFPKPIRRSDGGRGKAWLESELIAHQAARKAARDNNVDPPLKTSLPKPKTGTKRNRRSKAEA